MRSYGPRMSIGLGGINFSGPGLSFGGSSRRSGPNPIGQLIIGLLVLAWKFFVWYLLLTLLLSVWVVQYLGYVPVVAGIRRYQGQQPLLLPRHTRPWFVRRHGGR